MSDYEVIVIGGGSAGTAAARAASHAGARTAMINDGELGGLCILRGCMPTKAMLASAHAAHVLETLEPLGLRLEGRVIVDFPRLMERKQAQVRRFQQAKIAGIESQDYDVIDARATFTPDEALDLGGRRLTADRYVIATGSVPSIPAIPGLDQVAYLTSDDVMRLEQPPESLIVYGAGAIGLELAQFFARIGTRVLLVARRPLLHRTDADCGAELTRALDAEAALSLAAPASLASVEPAGSGVRVTLDTQDGSPTHEAAALLLATGRRPAVDGLGLEHVGLAVSDGRLSHDVSMRTAHPRIYVAGDTTGSYQILHLANQEGRIAGHNAAAGDPAQAIDYRLQISVIFTDPPLAQIGLSTPEVEAQRERGREIVEAVARFPETGRAITMGAEYGLWKLFVDAADCRPVGSVILGPRADDLIHLISMMMYYGGRFDDVARLPWYHPTLSEVMINLERDLADRLSGCERAAPPPA